MIRVHSEMPYTPIVQLVEFLSPKQKIVVQIHVGVRYSKKIKKILLLEKYVLYLHFIMNTITKIAEIKKATFAIAIGCVGEVHLAFCD